MCLIPTKMDILSWKVYGALWNPHWEAYLKIESLMRGILCFWYKSLDFKILKVQEGLCKIIYINTDAKSEQFYNENLYKLLPKSGLARAEDKFICNGGSASHNLIFHQHCWTTQVTWKFQYRTQWNCSTQLIWHTKHGIDFHIWSMYSTRYKTILKILYSKI